MNITITQEVLDMYPYLANYGAQIGDEISDGKIVHNFSEPSDLPKESELSDELTVTDTDIIMSPNLQALNALPGDKVVNGKLVRLQKDEWLKDFNYMWDKEDGLTQEFSDYMAALTGIGFEVDPTTMTYYSAEELYGPGWNNADRETRRQLILSRKQAGMQEKYGEYKPRGANPSAEVLGGLSAEIVDPTTLIPVGKGVKAGAAVGSAFGGADAVLNSSNQGGEIDAGRVALQTGLGAGIGGGLGALFGKPAARSLTPEPAATQTGMSTLQEGTLALPAPSGGVPKGLPAPGEVPYAMPAPPSATPMADDLAKRAGMEVTPRPFNELGMDPAVEQQLRDSTANALKAKERRALEDQINTIDSEIERVTESTRFKTPESKQAALNKLNADRAEMENRLLAADDARNSQMILTRYEATGVAPPPLRPIVATVDDAGITHITTHTPGAYRAGGDKVAISTSRLNDRPVELRANAKPKVEPVRPPNVKGEKLTFKQDTPASPAAVETSKKVGGPIMKPQNDALSKTSAFGEIVRPISTRLGRIHPALKHRMREFEFFSHFEAAKDMVGVKGFVKGLKKFTPEENRTIKMAALNGEFDKVRAMFRAKGLDDSLVSEVEMVTQGIHQRLGSVGFDIGDVANYFPRRVKHGELENLLKAIGREERSSIEHMVDKFAKAQNVQMSDVTAEQVSDIINAVMRNRSPKDLASVRGYQGTRKLKVTEDTVDLYDDLGDALSHYIRSTNNDINKARFFGKNKKVDGMFINNNASIGELITNLEFNGHKLSTAQKNELQELLNARFVGGELGSGRLVQGMRNMMYLGTIANPMGALTQFKDFAQIGTYHGIANTIASIWDVLGKRYGDRFVDMTSLSHKVSEELHQPNGKLARLLTASMKVSGFNKADAFTKEVSTRAALRKAQKMLKSEKGEKYFRDTYGPTWGDEIELLIGDLRANKSTERVLLHQWNELADMQPIAMSELSSVYANNPNGRIFFTLQSFTLKAWDKMLTDIGGDFSRGYYGKGVQKAATLMAGVMSVGLGVETLRDFALRRDMTMTQEYALTKAFWDLMGTYGVNRFTVESAYDAKGIAGQWTGVVVPVQANELYKGFKKSAEQFASDEDIQMGNFNGLLRTIPIIGPWVFGHITLDENTPTGIQKYNERKDEAMYND